MAKSQLQLIELYQEALHSVVASPENWLKFLESAGRNYRYPFQDQIMIHYQRPDAVAVLELGQWNKRFGRWVNRGATGIAAFGRSQGRTYVKYYFDVTDTHSGRESVPVPLWSVAPDDHGPILSILEQKYETTAPIVQLAVFEAAKSCSSAAINAYWEDIQAAQLPASTEQIQSLLENSTAYLLLYRLDMMDFGRFYPQDFDTLELIQAPEHINFLGDMVSTISEEILVDIAATVRAVHKNGPDFFARSRNAVYYEDTKAFITEQGGQDYGTEPQHEKRLQSAEPDTPGGAGGDGQVRDAPGELPAEPSPKPVPEPADQREAESAPDGDPDPSNGDDGALDASAPEGGRDHRGSETAESYGMGGTDEQPPAQRGGNDSEGSDLQLTPQEPEPTANGTWSAEGVPVVQLTPSESEIISLDSAGGKTPPAFSYDSPQLSMFNPLDVVDMETEDGQLSFMPGPQYSQDIIDDALRIGANDTHSRLIITAYMMKNKSEDETAAFLQKHYGTNGAGFLYKEQQYAIWYNSDGVSVAAGKTAQSRMARTLSWNEVAARIRELLDEGRYIPQRELDQVVDYEMDTISDRLALTARDMTAEAKEAGYATTILETVGRGVFPESKDNIRSLLSDPEMLQTAVTEWGEFVAAFEKDRGLMRFPYNRPSELLIQLQNLQIEPITFHAAEDFDPLRRYYISDDEIDQLLRRGNSNYRLSVYNFFQSHPDTKERENHLKHYHGEYSGYHSGNDNVTYTTKKITFSHGSITNPYAEVELSWNKAAKRIASLLEADKFLMESDHVVMDLREEPEHELESKDTFVEVVEDEPEVDTDTIPAEQPIEVIPSSNFRITDDNLGCGSIRQKFTANIAAIRLLKELERDDRNATPEEQDILSRYVGWGGMPQAFDPDNDSWKKEYTQLRELLDDHEYSAAKGSVLNAHYTSPTVIKGIYEAVGNMGFTYGNILEPACGVGNFFGMLPDAMQNSKLYGVELDSITGRIAKKLYPEADITIAGFETTDRRNFYDLAIGNVPFGNYRVNDKAYNKLGFNIHNYFFAKSLDQVRPGGIVAFVTSRYTMDSKSSDVRKHIAERAELLGAIRLPNNAFQANAGTTVVSDIIFLQKRERMISVEPDWVHLGKTEDGITLNSYFIDHPEMVLGQLSTESTQYGKEECTVIPIPGADLSQQLHEAVQHIHGQYTEMELTDSVEIDDSIPADPNVKNFSFTLVDDCIYYRENSRMKPVSVSDPADKRIRKLIELRDCVRTLITYETEDYSDADIETQQLKLNKLYDSFQKEYGIINSRANRLAFSEDDSYYLLCSLEILDDEQNFKQKADIFTKRTIRPKTAVNKVESASEALVICLNDRACVDMKFMSILTGKNVEQLEQELTGQIFRVPDTDRTTFVLAEEYLSGNVRDKLRTAREYAEKNAIYAASVTALERVQPQDLSAAEISVRLGTTWIPEEDIRQFVLELLQPPYYLRRKIQVHYSSHTGAWQIEGKSTDAGSVYASSTYGTQRASAYHIIEDTLNLRDVRIFDYIEVDGVRKAILNKKETTIAQSKQAAIKQEFQNWIWKDPRRRERLTKYYNETFNNIRPREYDGSHLEFPGMNPEITLRPHQKNAIARALYGGNTLLAHCVGAGKTFEMVTIAQESKRLGLCNKSMIVVPNHLIGQWASEYLQLYPAANILVATEKDFTPARRKTFCSRISTGDYDAVIIGHSQFEKIPLSKERQAMQLQHQIDDILDGIAEAKCMGGSNFTVKQLERSRKSVEAKLRKLNDQSRKDDVVTFEELGIDRLFVDEAHAYKNLAVVTKMQNVAGISQTESQKASDMFMKCQYLDEITDAHGVIFGTGTPISNTMVEMYTMQRYLQYRTLEYYGLQHFDAWAANFGETVTAIELAPEGTGYRTKTRFSRFYNLPELIYMFRQVADIQTADMLNLPVPKANYHVVQLEPSEIQKEMVQNLSDRADRVRNKMVDSKEDNMLRITGDGRKLALDQRLMNPILPDDPDGKSAACARNVYDIWKKTAYNKGAQIIFCDLSTPHFDGNFNVYDDIRDKLTDMGIPKEEIVYIHEAPTEARKKELFAKVRSGQVRVLIGSTAKMGTGTNVQTRLAALHDIDCRATRS